MMNKMKPKAKKMPMNITLYFCPKCEKGHILKYNQPKCDICGVELDWRNENE